MEKPSTIRLHFVLLVIVSALTLVDCLPAQALTTIYNFTAQSTCCGFPTNNDGSRPVGVIALGNTLYGTAQSGGISGIGTVFKVNVDGTGFTVLHYFTNSANPLAGLISSGNTLFGTTECCYGSVFAINTDGMAFRTLHFFPFLDSGMSPRAPLVMSGITLYGTSFGATPSFGYQPDPGSVFEINKDGTGFRYLYVFSIFNSGGAYPQAGLISSGDTFYGTASGGGSGNGTVFSLKMDGTGFTPLHIFTWSSTNSSGYHTNNDGANPASALVLSGDTLYGTASMGGTGGAGTVFKVNTNGSGFAVLHTFTSLDGISATNSDGAFPGGLVLLGNTLYGTGSGREVQRGHPLQDKYRWHGFFDFAYLLGSRWIQLFWRSHQ